MSFGGERRKTEISTSLGSTDCWEDPGKEEERRRSGEATSLARKFMPISWFDVYAGLMFLCALKSCWGDFAVSTPDGSDAI